MAEYQYIGIVNNKLLPCVTGASAAFNCFWRSKYFYMLHRKLHSKIYSDEIGDIGFKNICCSQSFKAKYWKLCIFSFVFKMKVFRTKKNRLSKNNKMQPSTQYGRSPGDKSEGQRMGKVLQKQIWRKRLNWKIIVKAFGISNGKAILDYGSLYIKGFKLKWKRKKVWVLIRFKPKSKSHIVHSK